MVSKTEIYNDIILVKEQIEEGMYDDVMHGCVKDYFKFVARTLNDKTRIRTRLALLTILKTGVFIEGRYMNSLVISPINEGYEFYYKIVKRDFKRGRATVFIWSDLNDNYEHWHITSKWRFIMINPDDARLKYKKSKHNKSYLHTLR